MRRSAAAGNVASDAPIDNVEHLYLEDLAAGTYWVQMSRLDTASTEPAAWPFAVAWVHPDSTPNFDPADINQDGAVDFQDLLLLLGTSAVRGDRLMSMAMGRWIFRIWLHFAPS